MTKTRKTTSTNPRSNKSASRSAQASRIANQASPTARQAATSFAGSFMELILSSRLALVAILLVFLALFGWGVDAITNHGKAYSGVSVGGVDVSGLHEDEIQKVIGEAYAARLSKGGVTVYTNQEALNDRIQDHSQDFDDGVTVEEARENRVAWSTNAESLQAYIDYEQLVDNAMAQGRSGILDRLALLVGTRDIEVPVNFNEAIVEALAHEIDLSAGKPLVNFDVAVADGYASVVQGMDGDMINRETFKEELSRQLLSEDADNRAILVQTEYTPVQITQEDAQKAADIINANIANGIRFACNDSEWLADSTTLGAWVQTTISHDGNDGYTLNPSFSLQSARSSILEHIQPTFDDGQGYVKFEKDASGITVRVTSAGVFPLAGDAVEGLNLELFSDGGKDADNVEKDSDGVVSVSMGTAQIPETMPFEDALSYGIVLPISTYETEYTTGAVERNTNIHLAADLIDESIVAANGGVWSFNDTTGECNAEKGFLEARAVAGAQIIDEIGGGICQVATTVFNAAYEAGFPIVERTNHTLYFANYPQGRDAAVSWPAPDLKWENDSTSDILLKTSYTDSTVTVTLYGVDPGYRVESEQGEWLDGAQANTVYEYDDALASGVEYVKTYGTDGHSISVTRTVYDADGEVLREDTFLSVYSPDPTVVVRGAAA